jgi:hypothetical protein
VADLFEQAFDQAGAVPVVINNQDASILLLQRPGHHLQLRTPASSWQVKATSFFEIVSDDFPNTSSDLLDCFASH